MIQKTNKLLIRDFGDGFFHSGIESILAKIPILIDLEVKLYIYKLTRIGTKFLIKLFLKGDR